MGIKTTPDLCNSYRCRAGVRKSLQKIGRRKCYLYIPMKLTNRIKQLMKFGLSLESQRLTEKDKEFEGDFVARFDEGEGLEYIVPQKGQFPMVTEVMKKEDGFYRLLVDEIGEIEAEKTFDHGISYTGTIIESERHVILDFVTGIKYKFEMPSRSYINPIQTKD